MRPWFQTLYPHNVETFSALIAPFEGNPLMTGVPPPPPPPPPSQSVSNAEFWPFIRSCLCSETPWYSCGVTVIETFIHSQYNPGCTINKAKQNKKCKQKSNSFDFTINVSLQKKVPRPNIDEINGVPSYMTPHACTQDPRFFSPKLLSKSFEIKPQLMMAAATGLPSVGYRTWCARRQSVCIVCSTIREVTNPLITKKPTDYRPSVPSPTYRGHFFNYLHNVF